MPNLASTLKQEITRLARKEIRAHLKTLRKSATQHRSEIAALKREAAQLKAALARLGKGMGRTAAKSAESEDGGAKPRFSVRSVVAQRNQRAKLPLWQSMAWGMLYGSLFSFAFTLASGKSFAFEPTWPYVLSLLYLAVLGSIVAFAGYLTLLERIGAARAGYIGVMTPVVALVISAFFEGFRWHALTFAGIAVTVLGNVVILRSRR